MNERIERVGLALEKIAKGEMIILIDDESRENEGDLIVAAEFATPEKITFMAREACGLVCLSLDEEIVDKLDLPMMTAENTSQHKTPFTVSVEAREGVTTGISAYDRAHTIQTLIAPNASANDWVVPGHIFPLKADPMGVLARAGHTEGAVDLARMAGLKAAAVLCEVMAEDGTMAKGDVLQRFAEKHQLMMLSIEDIIAYRQYHEVLIEEVASANLPTEFYGAFSVRAFREKINGAEHLAIISGDALKQAAPLVRVHSSCVTGDVFGSRRCDCGHQLDYALNMITQSGGIVLYLQQEGRGIGLANKIKAYALQEQGMDTVEANHHLGFEADLRSFIPAAQILKQLGVHRLKLLTNNPQKVSELDALGLEIVSREPVITDESEHNKSYLLTKKEKLGHYF